MVARADSGWPIPRDWDGESWTCWAVRWPDSKEYRRLLTSLLFTLTRGREYDRHTGTITDAQEVGWLIFDGNTPLAACVDDATPTDVVERVRCIGGGSGGKLRMVTRVYIDYETAELVVQDGQCCEQRFSLAFAVPPGYEWPDEDLPDLPGSTGEPTACTKAHAIMRIVFDMVDRLFDILPEAGGPSDFINNVRSAWPMVNFGDLALAAMYASGMTVSIQGLESETEDETVQQEMLCRVAQLFEDGQQPITDEQYSGIDNAVMSVARRHFTLLTYPTGYGSMRNVYSNALTAIGKSDTINLTKLLQPGSENCACPGDAPWAEFEWYRDYDFAESQHSWSTNNSAEYVAGTGWQSLAVNPTVFSIHSPNRDFTTDPPPGVLRYVRVDYTLPPGHTATGTTLVLRSSGNTDKVVISQLSEDELNAGGGSITLQFVQPYDYQQLEFLSDIRLGITASGADGEFDRIVVKRLIFAGTGWSPFPEQ